MQIRLQQSVRSTSQTTPVHHLGWIWRILLNPVWGRFPWIQIHSAVGYNNVSDLTIANQSGALFLKCATVNYMSSCCRLIKSKIENEIALQDQHCKLHYQFLNDQLFTGPEIVVRWQTQEKAFIAKIVGHQLLSDLEMTNILTNWLYDISGLFIFISFRRALNSRWEICSPQLHNKCRSVSTGTLLSPTNGDTLNAFKISSGIFSTCDWA